MLNKHLDEQLQQVLDEVRSLGLGAIRTAQAAIDQGKVEAWQRYQTLTDAYSEIRAAQQLVAQHLVQSDLLRQPLETFGAVRNYAELFPGWFDRQRQVVIGTVNGEPVHVSPPWSDSDPLGLWQYAVQHDEVELWVPTPAQVQAAYTMALTEARQVENARARED